MRASIVAVILLVLLILGGLFLFKSKKEPKKEHNWQQSYKVSTKYQPYEKGLLYQSLKSELGDQFKDISGARLLQTSLNNAPNGSVYFCVRKGVYLDSAETEAVVDFIHRGNQVFLAAEIIPDGLINKLLGLDYAQYISKTFPDDVGYEEDLNNKKAFWKESVSPHYSNHLEKNWASTTNTSYMNSYNALESHLFLSSYKDSVQLKPMTSKGARLEKNWRYFDAKTFRRMSEKHELNEVKPMAYMRKKMGYSPLYASGIEIDIGKGKAVLLSNPIVLTNFFLKDTNSFNYASKLLASLDAENLYWDNNTRERLNRQSVSSSESYYRVLLSNPNLSKAFYIFVLVSFLYVLLSIKRKQRSIPVSEPNDNTSLEYSNTIARLYYLNPNHKLILEKKRQYFQNFVNKRYSLLSQDDEEYRKILAKKSGVDLKYINKLYNSYKLADSQTDVKEYLLMQVADLQQYFYSNCK